MSLSGSLSRLARTRVGYRWFLEGDLFGIEGYLQVGGGLELPTGDDLPLGKGIALTGAAILGHDISSWTVGISLDF